MKRLLLITLGLLLAGCSSEIKTQHEVNLMDFPPGSTDIQFISENGAIYWATFKLNENCFLARSSFKRYGITTIPCK